MAKPSPQRLVFAIARFMARAPAAHNPRLDEHAWRRIVGLDVAARTRPTRLAERVLSITVATSAWAQELQMLEGTLVKKLVAAGFDVEKLKLRVGVIPKQQRSPEIALEVRRVPKRAPLPHNVAEELARLDDHGLRDVIATAARQNLAWQGQSRAVTSKRRSFPGLQAAEAESARSVPASVPGPSTSRRRDEGG